MVPEVLRCDSLGLECIVLEKEGSILIPVTSLRQRDLKSQNYCTGNKKITHFCGRVQECSIQNKI